MKFVKNVITMTVTYAVIGAGLVLGTKVAQTAFDNGLGDKVTEVSKKLFQRK